MTRVTDQNDTLKRQVNEMQRWNGYTEFMGWMKEFVHKDYQPKTTQEDVKEQ